MFKETIQLKQHSPIIHFQAEDVGATLRVTELKPKLDKFIVNELKTVDPESYEFFKGKITDDNFPINKDKKVSSPYKIKIKAEGRNQIYRFAPYLKKEQINELRNQNIIGVTSAPYFSVLNATKNDNINITISSYDEKLLELVVFSLNYVLSFYNFGSRQTKGFGGFLPIDTSTDDFEGILLSKYETIFVSKNKFKSVEDSFKFINKQYQILKSGINFNEYIKSKLYKYFSERNIIWEKKKIKEAIDQYNITAIDKIILKNTSGINSNSDNGNSEYRYIRALLGLAEHNEYQLDNSNDKIIIKITDPEKNEDRKIYRYNSPITYKVAFDKVYMLVNSVNTRMLNKEFDFSMVRKKKSGTRYIEETLQDKLVKNIMTPNEFNLFDFVNTMYNNKEFGRISRQEVTNG